MGERFGMGRKYTGRKPGVASGKTRAGRGVCEGMMNYTIKTLLIWWNCSLMALNRVLLKTYPSNYDCARCRDCGRTVHDFHVSDELWMEVIGHPDGVWCWDCFCERAREKDKIIGLSVVGEWLKEEGK